MKKQLILSLLISLVLLPFKPALAVNVKCPNYYTGLVFDKNLPSTEQFEFIDEQPELPESSDFLITSYYPMSNACGERWVLVTLQNTSPGTSSISNDGLVVLLSDGNKRAAQNFKIRVAGKTSVTKTVYFGKSEFPIIKVMTRPK